VYRRPYTLRNGTAVCIYKEPTVQKNAPNVSSTRQSPLPPPQNQSDKHKEKKPHPIRTGLPHMHTHTPLASLSILPDNVQMSSDHGGVRSPVLDFLHVRHDVDLVKLLEMTFVDLRQLIGYFTAGG